MAPLASLANFFYSYDPYPLSYNIIPYFTPFVKGLFRLRVASCVLKYLYIIYYTRRNIPDGFRLPQTDVYMYICAYIHVSVYITSIKKDLHRFTLCKSIRGDNIAHHHGDGDAIRQPLPTFFRFCLF